MFIYEMDPFASLNLFKQNFRTIMGAAGPLCNLVDVTKKGTENQHRMELGELLLFFFQGEILSCQVGEKCQLFLRPLLYLEDHPV